LRLRRKAIHQSKNKTERKKRRGIAAIFFFEKAIASGL
jgi:hypothetical protein